MSSPRLDAFMGYGIEIEYAIVDRDDLSCRPIGDRLLFEAAGAPVTEVNHGLLGWSNELVLHVIEVKNLRPTAVFEYLPAMFQNEVRQINRQLRDAGARLMPSAMHPWMDPRTETRLWPHDNAEIYQAYERIFDVATHGWANLQSMHLNMPFADDAQFARLHAAIRLVLPIIPALAASSPIADAQDTGYADYRMEVYRSNADLFPSIVGNIIPETISSRAEYERKILAPMYRDIAPLDPARVLQREWLNSRGAIARFDRNAIEIRVIDTQECPKADLAVAAAVISTVHMLYRAETAPLAAQQEIDADELVAVLLACTRYAEQAEISQRAYLELLGYPGAHCSARDLWRHLIGRMQAADMLHASVWLPELQLILEHGPLARRILRAVGGSYSRSHLETVYRQLCDCLEQGTMFLPE
ncbi:MAG TPA: glutamate-cysteine ligase family protein [Burkholderiaceae bacterium]|jgi:gamma-glutamyl:cysteine ligase YbdK (ATP-grasp superfamily)|nr:glutamate-cysteine ligase family protein [Burkholderiaceae bacterium]